METSSEAPAPDLQEALFFLFEQLSKCAEYECRPKPNSSDSFRRGVGLGPSDSFPRDDVAVLPAGGVTASLPGMAFAISHLPSTCSSDVAMRQGLVIIDAVSALR